MVGDDEEATHAQIALCAHGYPLAASGIERRCAQFAV
jgi:hypothetical protein